MRRGRYRIIYKVFDASCKVVILKIVKRDEKTYKNLS
jgi:mRNA-degrading endonuclease RelE of RelBE toxin-antitoxin system